MSGLTHCTRGHPLYPENIIRNGVRAGRQRYTCRVCAQEKHVRRYAPHPHPQNGPRPGVLPADAAFLHWLAGFVDGEGSFFISRGSHGNWCCGLRLSLRDDDSAILEEIRDRLGLGTKIYRYGERAAAWNVSAKADCLRLVEVFDEFPLRAKKARDYAIWREAVLDWATAIKSRQHDWTKMAACATKLKEVRRYA